MGYGTTNLAYLRELLAYWRDGFDWRAQEAAHTFAHFPQQVGGIGIHFVHERGSGERPLPIVLSHGWPSDVRRDAELLPRLRIRSATAATQPMPSTSWCRRCRASASRTARGAAG